MEGTVSLLSISGLGSIFWVLRAKCLHKGSERINAMFPLRCTLGLEHATFCYSAQRNFERAHKILNCKFLKSYLNTASPVHDRVLRPPFV